MTDENLDLDPVDFPSSFSDTETMRIGDRLLGFSVLLPAEPKGKVVLAVDDVLAQALRQQFTDAVVLGRHDSTSFLKPGTVGLLVVDSRLNAPARFTGLLAAEGVVATIGRRGRFALYPNAEHPESIWRWGWPLPFVVGRIAQLRRSTGLVAKGLRGVPHLELRGAPYESLADRVGRELGHMVGDKFRLVGITTAGHTILRFSGRREVAVRLSCVELPDKAGWGSRVAREVPAVADLVGAEIANGSTCGNEWIASPWVLRKQLTLLGRSRSSAKLWNIASLTAAKLETSATGSTGPGWSEEWLNSATLVPDLAKPRLLRALSPLDDGLPTGWCHGDLWPGNILLGQGRATVIDWDNASANAPLGVDRILVAAHKSLANDGTRIEQACTQLVDDADFDQPISGRPWLSWDRPTRVAFALSACLLYLRNRAFYDLGEQALADIVSTMLELADSVDLPDSTDEVSGPMPRESRKDGVRKSTVVGGAGWLGLGAGTVKMAQTAVLLVLAAILAPSALGILAIGALILNASNAITSLGSSTALVYWRDDAERAARSALTIALGLALVLTSSFWLLAPWLSNELDGGPLGSGVIRGLMLCLPFYSVSGVSGELLRRKLAFRRRVTPDIISSLVGASVSVVLAIEGHGVYSLVIGQFVQAVLAMLLFWMMRPPVFPGWNRVDASGLIAYGGNLAGGNILQLLMLNVDYIIIARVLGSTSLGEYSMAFRLAYMPYLLVAVVMTGAAFPHLCRLRGTALGEAMGRLNVALLTVMVPLCLGMVLLAPQLELLGHKWAPAVPALRWLAAYSLLLGMIQLARVQLNSVGRTRDTLIINLTHLILLMSLLLVWAQRGVAFVSIMHVVAAIAVVMFALILLRRNIRGFDWKSMMAGLVPVAGGAALMVVVVLSAQELMPWTRVSVSGLLIVGTLAVAAYALPVQLFTRGGIRAAIGTVQRQS